MLFSPAAWLKTPTVPINLGSDSKKKAKQLQKQLQAGKKPEPDINGEIPAPVPGSSSPPDSADSATHAIPCRHVTFSLDDGASLYSNTWVLSLHSPVFEAMFSSQFAEADQPVVKLPGKPTGPMRALLNCLHNLHFCRPISNFIPPDIIIPVIALIKEYQIQVLWEPAVQYLRGKLDKTNIVAYFREVLEYQVEELEYSLLAEMSLLFSKCLRTLETQQVFKDLNRSVRERILSALCVFHRVIPSNEVLGEAEWFGHDPNCKGCGRVKDIIVECEKCLHDNFLCSHCRQYGIFICYACNEENPLNVRRMRQPVAPADRLDAAAAEASE